MLKIENAEGLIDEMLTISANVIEVEAMEQTAIGRCESAMNLYIFLLENANDCCDFHSVVIADSESHGIRVFIVQDLHADNVLPVTEEENTSKCEPNPIEFPEGTEDDFKNALRIVNAIQVVTFY